MSRDETSSGPDGRTYSVNELADAAGVTRRTIHYYIAEGLLPASGSEGRGTRYGHGHLDRLRLIRELQREHLPLAEIRTRLEHLDDAQVEELLATGEIVPAPKGSAFDYIQAVLAGTNRRVFPPPLAVNRNMAKQSVMAPPAAAPSAAAVTPLTPLTPPVQAAAPSMAAAEAPVPYSTSLESAGLVVPSTSPRSQWEHVVLAPGVELHVRRPLTRLTSQAVRQLVDRVREILEENPS